MILSVYFPRELFVVQCLDLRPSLLHLGHQLTVSVFLKLLSICSSPVLCAFPLLPMSSKSQLLARLALYLIMYSLLLLVGHSVKTLLILYFELSLTFQLLY